MSAKESTGETGKKTSLFGFLKRGGGKKLPEPEEKTQEPGDGFRIPEPSDLPDLPEGAGSMGGVDSDGIPRPMEPPPPPPTPEALFEEQPAPDPLLNYFQQYLQQTDRVDPRRVVMDFCAEPLPEIKLLRKIFTQLGSKANAALKDLASQQRLADLKAKQNENILANHEGSRPPKLEPIPVPSIDGEVVLFADPKMSAAWAFAFPPLGPGKPIEAKDVRSLLKQQQIVFGVDELAVEQMVTAEKAFRLIQLAVGKPSVPGVDGRIDEHYPRTVGTPQIIENAQGIVDFENLNWLVHIDQGTVICDITEPTEGVPGTDIQGNPLNPYNGKKQKIPKGDGTELTPDGSKLVAKMDGQISFRDGKFHVNNTIMIRGDVDLSTGSLDVKGDVIVHGNVLSGFDVKATGNITIGGRVGNSLIEAGGNIVVNLGVSGNVNGTLIAGKDVICKYIENANVEIGGDLKADSIINCTVSAKGRAVARTGRGTIVGGNIHAMGGVEARIIGNNAGRLTTLILGPTPKMLMEEAKMAEQLQQLEDSATAASSSVAQLKARHLQATLAEIQQLEEAAARKQIVAGRLLPAVQVTIGGVQKTITQSFSPCRIYLDPREDVIKVTNM